MISPEFRKAQAILLRVGSHSLILASCETSNIWPRGRDADNEPGLCRCRDTGKTEGPVGNHGAAPGHSQHGAVFPVACSSSQTKSTHTRPAAATAKSLQLCPTLCNAIDGSPAGSPIPGIL